MVGKALYHRVHGRRVSLWLASRDPHPSFEGEELLQKGFGWVGLGNGGHQEVGMAKRRA